MRRALVTGASGFIGTALVRHLRRAGYHVAALGRSGPVAGAQQTLAPARWDDPEDMARALAAARPDVVFHLAGAAIGTPEELHRVNVAFATALLAAAARLDPPPRVLLAGTAAEYGAVPAAALPVDEEFACAPEIPYGRTKLLQTEIGLAAAARGLPVTVARLFNVIGPGMRSYLSLGRFVRDIAGIGPGGGVLETGPLDAERDFVAVGDAVRVLEALGRTPEAAGRVVNVCTGRATRLESLVALLLGTAGRPIELVVNGGHGGVSAVSRMVGSTARLAGLGLAAPVPDFPALLAEMLEAAGDGARGRAEMPRAG